MNDLFIIALTVLFTLTLSWVFEKSGLHEYVISSARRAAQEVILRSFTSDKIAPPQDSTPKK
jgi:hypothetical protein